MPPPPAEDRARDERGLVGGPSRTHAWEGLVAMALLWAVPVLGFVCAMVLGGSHP